MSDYTDQPPPSTGTLAPSVNQGGPNLPATGSEFAPLVGLGLIATFVGAFIVAAVRRRRLDPWHDQERERQRAWDQLAADARARGATEYRTDDGEWRPLP